MFNEPVPLTPGIRYTLEVQYIGPPFQIMYGRNGLYSPTVQSPCGQIRFDFSGGTGGTNIYQGQFARILYSC